MHTDTHRHTHTPRRCSTVVSTRAALRPKRLKESETGSFSVRGTTPPISPRTTTRTLFNRRARHPSSPGAGQVSLPPAASPLTSQHDDDPGQWYWFRATASTGMGGVVSMFVAPGRADVYVAHRTGLWQAAYCIQYVTPTLTEPGITARVYEGRRPAGAASGVQAVAQ